VTPPSGEGLSGRQPKAVRSALKVLEAVAASGTGVTAKEIARELDMPSATTYRLLNILVGEGYLVRLPDLGGFALGQPIGGLLGAALPQTVCHAARQSVARLRTVIRFPVHLVLYTATAIRVVDADPDHPLQSEQVLTRYLHASAAGKLLLSEQPNWRDIFPESRLVAITSRTIVSPTALDAKLLEFRAAGVSHQVGELRPDEAGIAVSVRSVTGTLVGALVLSGPVERLDALRGLIEPMRNCAEQLGPLLA
jgi:DNA-binding IclR family transcriptional regulator